MPIRCVDSDQIGELEINSVEHDDPDWRRYWDDVSGQVLNPQFTQAARREEIECVKSMKVYKKFQSPNVWRKPDGDPSGRDGLM